MQRTILKSVQSRLRLSFNIKNVDDLFPGFMQGDFAVLHGSSSVLSLAPLLCVRAQLPYQLRGLETNVIFVDGGNTFRLYDVSYVAQLHMLDPREVLRRIFISRAFTAYQMTSLLLDRLEAAVEKYNAKLVIVSDIAKMYLDKDVPKREAKEIFSQLTAFLLTFVEEKRVILVATYPPARPSKHNLFFKTAVCGRANVVASVRPYKHSQRFILEKHPSFQLGSADFPSQSLSLTNFMSV